jgi:hypothetical protein
MAATIGAARSPLEMIAGGKDHVPALIQVVVRVLGGHSPHLRKKGLGIVPFTRDTGNRLETGPAKTCGLDSIRSESAQNVIRHEDLLAPARPLVEFAFRHAALIVAAAQRTLLILPQTKVGRLRYHRFVVRSLLFDEIHF